MAKPKVLLAEDNLINQMMVTELLEDLGLVVDVAENGEEAVNMCQTHKYDLIIMDLEMPKLNGEEAAKAIRQLDRYFAPIIALTAHERSGKVKALRSAGFNGFLQKPINQEELKKVVSSLLNGNS